MNYIIRDGSIDRYATNEDFSELNTIINEDLGRTLIYLSYCEGEKEDLIKTIEKIRENLRTRHTMSEDLEIALTEDYVVFNLVDNNQDVFNLFGNQEQPESKDDKLPEIVIMKRDMRGIYFLRKIAAADIFTEKKDLLSSYQSSYNATLYTYSNKQVKESQAEFDTYIKDELEEPFLKTDKFIGSLNKALSKIIIFNNDENK